MEDNGSSYHPLPCIWREWLPKKETFPQPPNPDTLKQIVHKDDQDDVEDHRRPSSSVVSSCCQLVDNG
ncbi:hypothetical protein TYRP_013682 [Tyrophagus putrescentiae]|nr:hypothetical protein TYRP_013682 [Tyrophagus putrescentiae]